jgi:ketosteroid isomerase-like protein
MTDRSTIETRLQELYAARVRGDKIAVFACFSDDAVLRFAGASGTNPIAVAASGGAEFRQLLTLMVKSFTLSEFTTLATLIDGTRAAVHWRARINSRITGTSVLTEFMDMFEVRDGRISSYTEFFAPR